MLYTIARWVWNITKWITGTIFGIVVVLAPMQTKDVPTTLIASVANWLFLPSNRILVLSIFIPLVIITVLSGIIVAIEDYLGGGRALKKYLRDVANKNQDLKPVGFAQQSALMSVSVPLTDTSIHPHATTDRPRYDMPPEQAKLLDRTRLSSDLMPEQREEQIQSLRVVWHSQIERKIT